jgi:cell division protein FtsZ
MEEAGVMNIHFAPAKPPRRVRIKVLGVGGAGGNAVNRMVEAGLADIDFYAINTDAQALDASRAHQTVVIGSRLTRGLGAGGDPEVGRQAAAEDSELLSALVDDADMVFVTAGMGGGTGTGAAPLIAAAARERGALTVAIVTRPFAFEGRRRLAQAEAGLLALRDHVDALLVIPNERLMEIEVADAGMTSVFRLADNVLYEATRGISDIIAQNAVVNLDFADVRTVMKDSGAAIMGTGRAAGAGRARLAAEQAIRSPLLEDVDIHGSRAVLVYLTAACVDREDLREAMGCIQSAAGNEAHVFFGFANTEQLGEDLQITVIATGFPGRAGDQSQAAVPAAAVEEIDASATDAAPETAAAAPTVIEPSASAPEAAEDPDIPPEPLLRTVGESAIGDGAETAVEHGGVTDASTSSEHAVEPAAEATAAADHGLAALAAAAGGQARLFGGAAEFADAHETSQRFLQPLGSVKLQDAAPEPNPTGQRFRSTVLDDDKLRPAWERKYVD